jgi:hypothetical protein
LIRPDKHSSRAMTVEGRGRGVHRARESLLALDNQLELMNASSELFLKSADGTSLGDSDRY